MKLTRRQLFGVPIAVKAALAAPVAPAPIKMAARPIGLDGQVLKIQDGVPVWTIADIVVALKMYGLVA